MKWLSWGHVRLPALSLAVTLCAVGQVSRAQTGPVTAPGPVQGRSSAIPIEVAGDRSADPTQALVDFDSKLRAVVRRPTAQNVLQATLALQQVELNKDQTAVLLGNTSAHSGGSPALTRLVSDPIYRRNFAALAELHLSSIGSTPDEALAIPVPQSDGGTSSLRVIGNVAEIRRAFTVKVFQQQRQTRAPCTGVLVAPQYIITALHCACADQALGLDHISYADDQGRELDSGITTVYTFFDGKPRSFTADDLPHICYDSQAKPLITDPLAKRVWGRDLLAAKLTDPAPDDFPHIAWLANNPQLSSARVAVVSGFGLRDAGDSLSSPAGLFPYATVIALGGQESCDNCDPKSEFVGGTHPVILDTDGLPNDTCEGDSGGPVFLIDKTQTEAAKAANTLSIDFIVSKVRVALVGITSRSVTGGKCGSGGIYEFVGAADIKGMLQKIGIYTYSTPTFVAY